MQPNYTLMFHHHTQCSLGHNYSSRNFEQIKFGQDLEFGLRIKKMC